MAIPTADSRAVDYTTSNGPRFPSLVKSRPLVMDVRVLGEEHGTDLGNLVSRGIHADVPAEMDGVSLFIDNVSRMVTISCSADASLSTSVYVYDSISIDEFWRYCTKEGGTTYLDGEALYNG